MNTHLIAPVAVLVVSAAMYSASALGDGGGYEFPTLIAVIMCLLGAGMLVQALKRGRAAGDPRPAGVPWGSVLPGIALFFGYLLLMQWLGFFTTSFLVFLVIALLYAPGAPTGASIGRIAGVAGVFTATLYGVFVLLLQVQFPRGVLF